MSKPFHDYVERDPGCNGRHDEAVPQAFRACLRAGQPGLLHHGTDGPPASHAAARSEANAPALAASALELTDAVY